MRADRFRHLRRRPVHRIEAAHRVLEDHRDAIAAQRAHFGLVERQQVAAVERAPFRRPTRPAAAGPAATVAVSDFPEPLSPTMASVSPGATSNDTSVDRLDAPVRRLDRDASDRAPRGRSGLRRPARRGRAGAARRCCRAAALGALAERGSTASRSASHSRLIARIVSVSTQARPEQQQRRLVHGGARAADHQAPGRRRRHDAEPEERQPALDHDRRPRARARTAPAAARRCSAGSCAAGCAAWRRRARAPPRHSPCCAPTGPRHRRRGRSPAV